MLRLPFLAYFPPDILTDSIDLFKHLEHFCSLWLTENVLPFGFILMIATFRMLFSVMRF